MKKHNGMRAHDIVILLKIIAKANEEWLMKDLAYELFISSSEVSESLNRSSYAGLIASDKKTVLRQALMDFLSNGIQYVFPQKTSGIVRGIVTAHSASPLNKIIQSNQNYVWAFALGEQKGQAIEPLYKNAPKACLQDSKLYELLALVDAVRVGKVREKNIAIQELEKRIL